MVQDLIVKAQNLKGQKTTIVVSKAVSKKAVERNRIKRIIKEALKELLAKEGIVVIVKNNIANLKMQEVKKKLEPLLKKI